MPSDFDGDSDMSCVALNSTTLFSGSIDKSVKEWAVQSGECRRT